MVQSVESKVDVGLIRRMTNSKCYQLGIAPTKLADIITGDIPERSLIIEELRLRECTETLHKCSAVRTSGENRTVADIEWPSWTKSLSSSNPSYDSKLKRQQYTYFYEVNRNICNTTA